MGPVLNLCADLDFKGRKRTRIARRSVFANARRQELMRACNVPFDELSRHSIEACTSVALPQSRSKNRFKKKKKRTLLRNTAIV